MSSRLVVDVAMSNKQKFLKDWNISHALTHAEARAREVLNDNGYPSEFPGWLELTSRKPKLPFVIDNAVQVLLWAYSVKEAMSDENVARTDLSFRAFRFGVACDRADLLRDFFTGRAVRTKYGLLAEQRGNRRRDLVTEGEIKQWQSDYRKLKRKNKDISKRGAAVRIKAETFTYRSHLTIRKYL
ncbi:MAG: hypothetical protein QF661_13360 [Arenicellales bacterium]|nr:hypothetical protein [Arenicellales bacterium]